MRYILLSVLLLNISFITNAHSGRTDASGGHHNRKTGGYHYHNSGYSKTTSNYSSTTKLNKGKTSVYLIQAGLKTLGYYTGSLDGISGTGTINAIKNFQRNNSISVTGKADKETTSILFDKLKSVDLQ